MTTTNFCHVILTRFSVRAYPASPSHSPAWLEHRLDLFDAYCLPSMRAQTCQAFSWLIFCDSSTEEGCLGRLHKWEREIPQLKVVLTTPADPSYLAAAEQARPGDGVLITTRVDSDDASSIDLIERIQSYVPGFAASNQAAALLSFCRGFKLDEDGWRLFEAWNPHSPHLSMFERLDGSQPPVTVQSGNHGYLQERYPLHVDAGPPAWVQVIHGGNVHNRIWVVDWETPTSALDGRFIMELDRPRIHPVPADQPKAQDRRLSFRQALEESLLGAQSDSYRASGRQPSRDRISEIYEGKVGEPEQQRIARDRIDWMCDQGSGGRTLDVGCSQGRATILMARRGITCTGIDHEPDRLAYAISDLGREELTAARRAGFMAGDAAFLPFADDSFETVLLGGILGHLKDPARVLAECGRVLAPSGRLVVTTAFGTEPHHDLKSTFLPASLAGLVGQVARVVSLEVVDLHIRLLAEAVGRGDPDGLVAQAQPHVDAILFDHQRRLIASEDEIRELAESLARTRVRADRLRSRVEKRERQLDRLNTQKERLERRVAHSERRVLAIQATRWFRLGVAVRHLIRSPLRIPRFLAEAGHALSARHRSTSRRPGSSGRGGLGGI
ncbi:MAG: glycosyltransferase [Actinomycetota bacterium]